MIVYACLQRLGVKKRKTSKFISFLSLSLSKSLYLIYSKQIFETNKIVSDGNKGVLWLVLSIIEKREIRERRGKCKCRYLLD